MLGSRATAGVTLILFLGVAQLEEFSEAEDCEEAWLLNSWRNPELTEAFRIEHQVGNPIQKVREGSPKGCQHEAPGQTVRAGLQGLAWRRLWK